MATKIRNAAWKTDDALKKAIESYLKRNYLRAEMLDYLKRDFSHYSWSFRTLDRRMRHFDLYYTDKNVSVEDVKDVIKKEFKGPGVLLGYRAMHQKVRQVYDMRVPRAVVHAAMFEENPAVLEERLPCFKKKVRKGSYVSPGPNWVHSLDGHDKLMGYQNSTFPAAVYDSIDICSRKIMWLKVWSSNSDPLIIGRFYLEHLFETKTIARHIRVDRGSETIIMGAIHAYLHRNNKNEDPTETIIFGPSTSNQIERWWKDLHERLEKHFKVKLAYLKGNGYYDPDNEIHRNLLAYILVPIIQEEADIFVELWNTHRIRAQDTLLPNGVPNHIHAFPKKYDLEDWGSALTIKELEDAAESSEIFTEDNRFDYIPADVRRDCERLLSVNKDCDLINGFIFLKNNYSP